MCAIGRTREANPAWCCWTASHFDGGLLAGVVEVFSIVKDLNTKEGPAPAVTRQNTNIA